MPADNNWKESVNIEETLEVFIFGICLGTPYEHLCSCRKPMGYSVWQQATQPSEPSKASSRSRSEPGNQRILSSCGHAYGSARASP